MEQGKDQKAYQVVAYILIGVGAAILLVVGAVALVDGLRGDPPVPAAISRQLDFSPLVVTDAKKAAVTVSSYKYDATNKTYTYIVRLNDSQQVTISEQAAPTNFDEIPELYTKLIDGLGKYDSVSTSNGTLQLTRPKDGKQVAVLNERGVLLFARANKGDLSKGEWKTFIELLDLYKLPS